MTTVINISQLEDAINHYKRSRPFADGVLPLELRLMATLYGEMIYYRMARVDLSTQAAPVQVLVMHWR
jgi:hypothetical protein